MIRELREENAKLLAQLMKGNQNITMDTTGASQEGEMGGGGGGRGFFSCVVVCFNGSCAEIEKVRVKMQSELSHTVS